MDIHAFPVNIFLLFTILLASLTVSVPSIFITCVTSGLFSMSCTLLYFFLNSPDVAMTEASIGVFLSSAFCLMTIRATGVKNCKRQHPFRLVLSLIICILLSFLLYNIVLHFWVFGKGILGGSAQEYLFSSYRDFKIANVITTVLGSFRGFDTMGETIIIFTSAIGVSLILKTSGTRFSSLN